MLTAVIITKNEEKNIGRCLESLHFCNEILVLDNNSSDKTTTIAHKLGARVEHFSGLDDYSAIRNRGLELAHNNWVLFVDADEVVSALLGKEIIRAIKRTDFNGYLIHRLDHLWGRELRYGDVGQVYLLRLGIKSAGTWVSKVHETWKVEGLIGHLHDPLYHYSHQTLEAFLKSINHYSTIRAQELFDGGAHSGLLQIIFYPLGKFIYLWIFKLGILDSMAGLIHAGIMSFYSFLVRGKLYLLSI